MTQTRLTEQGYWEVKQAARRHEPPMFDYVPEIIRHLPQGSGVSFLEIGCAPGRMLAAFCLQGGYEAHGVDFAQDAHEIESYLRAQRVRVGAVHRADFIDWQPGRKYDIVASFGFIEHFGDPMAVVDRHFELVRPGGHVVITVPNFARGQHLLHWLFDRENLHRHNLECMSLGYFRGAAARHRARVVSLRYTGGHYDLWRERPRSTRLRLPASNPRVWLSPPSAAHLILRRLAQLRPEAGNPIFSPYIVAILQAPTAAGRAD